MHTYIYICIKNKILTTLLTFLICDKWKHFLVVIHKHRKTSRINVESVAACPYKRPFFFSKKGDPKFFQKS